MILFAKMLNGSEKSAQSESDRSLGFNHEPPHRFSFIKKLLNNTNWYVFNLLFLLVLKIVSAIVTLLILELEKLIKFKID